MGGRAAQLTTGALVWALALWLIADRENARPHGGTPLLLEPAIGVRTELVPGAALPLVVELPKGADCALLLPEGEAVSLVEGRNEVLLPIPELEGVHLIPIPFRCASEPSHVLAREVELRAASAAPRREVARLHISARLLEETLSQALTALIGERMRRQLPVWQRELTRLSRRWGLPDLLLKELKLGSESRVSVRRVQVRFEERRIVLEARIQVQFEIFWVREAPLRRGGEQRLRFVIANELAPARVQVSLEEWPRVQVRELRLHWSGCQVSSLPGLIRDAFALVRREPDQLCDDLLAMVTPELELLLRAELVGQVNGLIGGVDLESHAVAPMIAWAERIGLADRVRDWLRDGDFRVSRVGHDAAGLHLGLEASAAWLGPGAWPERLELVDSPAELDLVASVGLLQRVLDGLAEVPVMTLLAQLAQAPDARVRERARTLHTRLSELMLLSEGERGSAGALLELAGWSGHPELTLRLRMGVTPEDHLRVSLQDLRALQTRQGDAWLSVSGWATLAFERGAAPDGTHAYHPRLIDSPLDVHRLAWEIACAEGGDVRAHHLSLLRFLRSQVSVLAGERDASLDGLPVLRLPDLRVLVGELPGLPDRLIVQERALWLRELRLEGRQQALLLRLDEGAESQ